MNVRPITPPVRFAHLFTQVVLGALLIGCKLDVLPMEQDMMIEDPPLDPISVFNQQAKTDLVNACQGCHNRQQDTIKPFLENGKEYESITKYENGKFLTSDPDQSILLRKGQHQGPALTSGQYDNIKAWLSIEAANRGAMVMSSPTTPSVAMRGGDFFLSLEKLVDDPLAKITFKVEPRTSGTYRISELKLTAGPLTGIKIKHPKFLIISLNGAQADKADNLSAVDLTVTASQSAVLGSGVVLLTAVPVTARLALAFEIISKVDPKPPGSIQCKDFMQFYTKVRPTLEAPCATVCHGAGATDPRAAQALGAFNMTEARSTVDAEQKQFCLRTLGRVNLDTPAKSVLVLQATPKEAGGTENHPYKLMQYMNFTQAVVSWAAAEKK